MNVAQIISLCRKKYLSLPRLSLGTRLTQSIGLIITVTSFILFIGIYRLEEQQAIRQINTEAQSLLMEMIVLRETNGFGTALLASGNPVTIALPLVPPAT